MLKNITLYQKRLFYDVIWRYHDAIWRFLSSRYNRQYPILCVIRILFSYLPRWHTICKTPSPDSPSFRRLVCWGLKLVAHTKTMCLILMQYVMVLCSNNHRHKISGHLVYFRIALIHSRTYQTALNDVLCRVVFNTRQQSTLLTAEYNMIWVRSRNFGCLVTWFATDW